MPDVLIRDLEESALANLKQEAERNHRSLQKELQLLISEKAARLENAQKITLHFAAANRPTQVADSRDKIYGDDGR